MFSLTLRLLPYFMCANSEGNKVKESCKDLAAMQSLLDVSDKVYTDIQTYAVITKMKRSVDYSNVKSEAWEFDAMTEKGIVIPGCNLPKPAFGFAINSHLDVSLSIPGYIVHILLVLLFVFLYMQFLGIVHYFFV